MLLRNRRAVWIATFVVSSFCFDHVEVEAATHVTIVADAAREGEFAAANELGCFLQRLYPNTTFDVGRRIDGKLSTKVVILGTRDSRDGLLNDEQRAALNAPGSFVVFTRVIDGIPTGCIIGADLEGIWNGVYDLLKALGCGFYLSFDAMPPQPACEFSFADWNLRDSPLVPVRLVFNWHNFLSGCSTWNFEHWRHWIVQSRKMGYNGLMVHAYGNNPMAGFTFDGQPKPVGYLASTRIGRDWNTHHVNDARRMVGGEAFDDPVFGCEAAIDGSHYQRTAASRQLMSKVFDAAKTRGMKVYFGVDVDTYAANPQELIKRLPDRARFVARIPGNIWLGQTPSHTEDEIGMSGLVSDAPIRFEIRPIMRIDSRRNVYREPPLLAPGRYRLDLLFGPGEHAKVAPGEIDIRVSTIKGRAGRDESTVTRRIAPSSPSNEKSSVRIESFDVLLAEPDAVTVELVPVQGIVWISGVVLAPVAD